MLNPDYAEHLNALLKDLDGVPNLSEKIKEMNSNRLSWKGFLSELEFAKKIEKLNPEFIEKIQSTPTVDLKANLLDTEIFFEVELLDDDYYKDGKIVVKVSENESNLTTKITYSKLSQEEIDKIMERRKATIAANKEDTFSIGDAEIRIQRNPPFPPTDLTFHDKNLGKMRKKILTEFKGKKRQLQNYSPIFLVIDCRRPYYNKGNFQNFIYGNNGLFTYSETKCLNGLVARLSGRFYYFPNSNAKTKINNYVEREMEKWFESNS